MIQPDHLQLEFDQSESNNLQKSVVSLKEKTENSSKKNPVQSFVSHKEIIINKKRVPYGLDILDSLPE